MICQYFGYILINLGLQILSRVVSIEALRNGSYGEASDLSGGRTESELCCATDIWIHRCFGIRMIRI